MITDQSKRRRARKTGRGFEQLVARIQESVHERAEIGINEKLKDIDTGKLRQIDLTIRLSDGPTEFLGIVEVRDRNCPIGIRYVEEISSKRRSVRADAAFIVSKSGFYKTAITKARQLGIRTLTYEEAHSADWSNWLQCRAFSIFERKYDKPNITFFEFGTDNIINIDPEIYSEFRNDITYKLLLNENGEQVLSLPDLVNKIINAIGDRLYNDIPIDGNRVSRRFLFPGRFKPSLWLKAKDGTTRQIGKVGIKAELYLECKEYPMKLMRYREVNSTESIAELATADVEIYGKKYKFEIVAPGAGEHVPGGATVTLRTIPIENAPDNKK